MTSTPTNLFSVTQYTNVPGVEQFTITFPYLRREHVFVFLSEPDPNDPESNLVSELVRGIHWQFQSDHVIELLNDLEIEAHQTLTIRRFTLKSERLASYNDGSRLTQKELNDVTLQLLYLIQEIDDFTRTQDLGGSIPGDGDAPPMGDIIDDVISQILDSQLFQDLMELIPLVDINAEAVMANILETHGNWKLGEFRDELLENQGAEIVSLENMIETETFALAEQINILSATVDGNQSTITTLGQVQSDQESSIALLVTELESRITGPQAEALFQNMFPDLFAGEFDDAIITSEYIQGIQTTVNEQGAEIEGIRSFLVGVGPGDTFEDPDPNSFIGSVSALQETVDGHADDISTSMDYLLAMASRFGGNIEDVESMASALEQSYQTYADEDSAAAQAVLTLQANTLPIYFSEDPPNYQDEPWSESPYADNTGFPEGTVWFRPWTTPEGGTIIISYSFRRDVMDVSEVDGISGDSPAHWFETIPGTNGFMSGAGRGSWVNQDATAVGALIQSISGVEITETSAEAQLRQLAEVVWEDNIAAIEQVQESWFDAETGHMNSQFMVRINQTSGEFPAMAGFGLGMQTDENNDHVSNFIVMANNFSVVQPPVGDPVTGVLPPVDGDNSIIPFLVDATNNRVIVNGDLIVEDTLYAYKGRIFDGLAGRLTFGQMIFDPEYRDEDYLDLVDPMGYRFELGSSTANMWTGTDNINYLMWAGTGAKNANNAVFFVDEHGNGFFGGQVQAQNIHGALADAIPLSSYAATVQAPANGDWISTGTEVTMEPNSLRHRRPFAMVNINMFGLGQDGGEARLQIDHTTTPEGNDWQGWTTVAQHSMSMHPYGHTLSLSGGLNVNTRGRIRIRVQIRELNGQRPESDGYTGILFALPTSGTSSVPLPPGTPGGGDEGDPGDDGGDPAPPPTPPPGGDGGGIIEP